MNIECKKTENCFSDSQTYEYRIPITAEHFLSCLGSAWELRRNDRLRRPVFLAEKNGVHMKGILKGNILRVSFPEEGCEQTKQKFESWLVTELEKIQS